MATLDCVVCVVAAPVGIGVVLENAKRPIIIAASTQNKTTIGNLLLAMFSPLIVTNASHYIYFSLLSDYEKIGV
jgi:hypothetical protein